MTERSQRQQQTAQQGNILAERHAVTRLSMGGTSRCSDWTLVLCAFCHGVNKKTEKNETKAEAESRREKVIWKKSAQQMPPERRL